MRTATRSLGLACLLAFACAPSQGSSGTEGASFLDIPVGARPAAMGAAYTALATDAYAPTWNPAGLASLDSFELAGEHLAYLQSTHYEYLSFGLPFAAPRMCTGGPWCGRSGVGASIQYLGSGDITGLNAGAQPTGSYSAHYAAYDLSYGRDFGDRLSLGLTGKLVNAALADVSANAFAADLGSLYRLSNKSQVAATLTNLGGRLTFLNAGDSLPLAVHLAGAYQPILPWNLSSELVIPRTGLVNFHAGTEWSPVQMFALRMGIRTDTLKGLSPLASFSGGFGIKFWNCEISYAWLPYGDLGDSHYLSLVMRFGEPLVEKRNLIKYQPVNKQPPTKSSGDYIIPK